MSHYTLFISDLHLQQNEQGISSLFEQFMNEEAGNADALYILGDLFDAWVGDDDNSVFHQSIKQRIMEISNKIPVFFIRGNRDFLVGKRFAEETGVSLLPDPSKVTIYQRKLLLCHGDSLCTLDIRHQRYRHIMYHPLVKKLLLSLPLALRHRIANYLRKTSQKNADSTANYIMDVTQSAVTKLMDDYQCNLLIHGHTHRPDIHIINGAANTARRVVLGDWHEDNARYLRLYPNGEMELAEIRRI